MLGVTYNPEMGKRYTRALSHSLSQLLNICQHAPPGGAALPVPAPSSRGFNGSASSSRPKHSPSPSLGREHLYLPSPGPPHLRGLPPENDRVRKQVRPPRVSAPRATHRYTTAGSNMLATSTLYSSRCGRSWVSGEGTRMGRGLRGQAPGSSSPSPPRRPPLHERRKTLPMPCYGEKLRG